jgi:hypothetical protein
VSSSFASRHSEYDTPARAVLSEQLEYYGLNLAPYDTDPMDHAIRRSQSPLAKVLQHRPDALLTFPTGTEPLAVQIKATKDRPTFSAELGAYWGTLDWNAALASQLLVACVDVIRGDVWLGYADQLPDPPLVIRLPRNPDDDQAYRREYRRIEREYPGVEIRPAGWKPGRWTNMAYVLVNPRQLGFKLLHDFVPGDLGVQLKGWNDDIYEPNEQPLSDSPFDYQHA